MRTGADGGGDVESGIMARMLRLCSDLELLHVTLKLCESAKHLDGLSLALDAACRRHSVECSCCSRRSPIRAASSLHCHNVHCIRTLLTILNLELDCLTLCQCLVTSLIQ